MRELEEEEEEEEARSVSSRAVLQERLKFTDAIKEHEKKLTKLKLEQELSESLAEEAISEAEVGEESIVEPFPHLLKDTSTTLRRFLNSEQARNTSVNPPLVTTTSFAPAEISTLNVKTPAANTWSTTFIPSTPRMAT